MRIFLTGATGFIGSALIPELVAAGHEVVGLTRSEAGEQALKAAGVTPYRGTLEEPDGLVAGAEAADAIIHLAFDHDFSRFVDNCEKDRRVIATLGSALAGSAKPMLITSGTGLGNAHMGEEAREDVTNFEHPNPRVASEKAAELLLSQGVNVSVVRLPQVHNTLRQGLISPLVEIARQKGVSAYVGEGANRWPACHLSDVVKVYRLAIERGAPGARYHAVAEDGVTTREIAEALGRGLNLPAVSIPEATAMAHFGWLGGFAGLDFPASSAMTRQMLGWTPVGPTLIADLDAAHYG
jgi:nucleoside-diphosphate-sugar epimerase